MSEIEKFRQDIISEFKDKIPKNIKIYIYISIDFKNPNNNLNNEFKEKFKKCIDIYIKKKRYEIFNNTPFNTIITIEKTEFKIWAKDKVEKGEIDIAFISTKNKE